MLIERIKNDFSRAYVDPMLMIDRNPMFVTMTLCWCVTVTLC